MHWFFFLQLKWVLALLKMEERSNSKPIQDRKLHEDLWWRDSSIVWTEANAWGTNFNLQKNSTSASFFFKFLRKMRSERNRSWIFWRLKFVPQALASVHTIDESLHHKSSWSLRSWIGLELDLSSFWVMLELILVAKRRTNAL